MNDNSVQTTHAPRIDDRFPVPVRGIQVDSETRCTHYDGPRDRIAIRFRCCDVFYPCFQCHRTTTEHDSERWPNARRHEPAVLCGTCDRTMSAAVYLRCNHSCPHCGSAFNPGCTAHHDRYFAFSP